MGSSFRFALALVICSVGTAAADPAWSTHDLDAVADAASETAAGQAVQVSWLAELADALRGAGDIPRAKAMLLKAATLLNPPTEFMASADRGNVVKGLAQLGDASDAEALTNVDAPPATKAMLLGKLVSGLAAAGDAKGVHRTADMMAPLADAPGITTWAIATPIASSLSGASAALVASGATDEALYLADRLPNGIPKLRVLSETAFALCDGVTKQADPGMGRKIVEDSVKSLPAALTLFDTPIDRVGVIETVAEAVAKCDGADRVKAFIADASGPEQTDQVRSKLADRLTDKHEFDLAAAVAPPTDPNDADSLLDAAKRLAKQGNRAAALRAATAASQVASKIQHDPLQPTANWFDHTNLLGRIFDVLNDLGAYDVALAEVQPIELVNRQHYYIVVVRTAIDRKDAATIAHTLPMALDAVKQPMPVGTRAAGFLFELTRALANGGYRDDAEKTYETLLELTNSSSATPLDHLPAWQLAVLKADMGDLSGALQAANDAGPLVTKPNPALPGVLAIMQFDGATKSPTKAELATAMQRAAGALPDLVSGPKASALSAIATDMAAQGDIKAALQIETELEAEPRAAVLDARDTALLSIATAQQKAHDLHGSLATTLRIGQASVRWKLLLKLAAEPPRQ